MGTICHANGNPDKAVMAVLMPDKVDFKAGSTIRNKGTFHNEKTVDPPERFYNINAPSNKTSKYMKRK